MLWGVVFGGICGAIAIFVLVASVHAANNRAAAANTETAKKNAKICEEQLTSGQLSSNNEASPCDSVAGPGAHEDLKGFAVGGALMILALAQLIGAARVGITLAGPGIIVRNPLRTYRLKWSEIEGFEAEFGQTGRLNYAFGRVDLLDGTSHRIEAICAMPWEPKEAFRDARVITALNAELAARRAESAEGAVAPPEDSDAAEVAADPAGASGTTEGAAPAADLPTAEPLAHAPTD